MSLKQKTISGFSWAFVDRFANLFVQFTFGIILARLLLPQDYGVIGMIVIFLDIADTLTIGGYGETLIRKDDPTSKDYSTVFVCNVVTGTFCYLLFFLMAPWISSFFSEPILTGVIRVIGLVIVINAFALVPRVHLWRSLDMKTLTKASVFSNGLSGFVAIILAFMGYGVWSLVWKNILKSLFETLYVILIVKPGFSTRFSYRSFREIFGFGSKLLASRLLNVLYMNIYSFFIGKYFSARDLGLYTRANGYKDMFSRTLTNIVKSVSFPALSQMKNDPARLKSSYRKLIQVTMYLTFLLMICLAAIADNFILGLIGSNWEGAVVLLKMLCVAGIFYPLTYLNLNMLVVKGRSDLNLLIEVLRKVLAIPVIILGLFFGLKMLVLGLVISSAVDYLLTSIWSGRVIEYSLKEQLKDILPSFFFALIPGITIVLIGILIPLDPLFLLAIQGVTGLVITLVFSEMLKIRPYTYLKGIATEKYPRLFSSKSGA